jgi:hypothetical protein
MANFDVAHAFVIRDMWDNSKMIVIVVAIVDTKILLIFCRCECNLLEYSSSKELDNLCREPYKENNETKLGAPCSDRGECLCGECYCNLDYDGTYCQCDECPRYKLNFNNLTMNFFSRQTRKIKIMWI